MAEVQAVNSSRALREAETRELATHPGEDLDDFVTFRVKKQLFGIPVLMVQDILSPDRISELARSADRIGDVVSLSNELYERNPATLDSLWREFANGIYRLKGELMVVLDVHRLLNISVRP